MTAASFNRAVLPSWQRRELDTRLIDAAGAGKTEDVRALLDRGADIHAWGDWPLRSAAWSGYTETVKLLLDRGADIHAQNDLALCWAAHKGHTETVRLLLDRGAVRALLPDEKSLFNMLAEPHRQEPRATVLNLIAAGKIDVNVRNGIGKSFLHLAADQGLTPYVEALLKDSCINPNLRDRYGRTALFYALENGRKQSAACLLSHPAVCVTSTPQNCPTQHKNIAFYAFEMGIATPDILLRLLREGETPLTERDHDGCNLLHAAAYKNNTPCAEMLLRLPGAEKMLQEKDCRGSTPAVAAALLTHRALAEKLAQRETPIRPLPPVMPPNIQTRF